MRGWKRGFILIVLLGIILLALSGSSTMVQNVSASTTYNILYMVGAYPGSTLLSTSGGGTEYSNLFDVASESITWSKSDWASNWWAGVDATSWMVGVDCKKGTGTAGVLDVTIGLTGKTSKTLQVTSGGARAVVWTTAYDTTDWYDRDAITTWLNDGTGSRTLSVTLTLVSGTCTVYWGLGTATSRENTGTIVPENLLLLVFAVPLIPLFAKSLAKRGRVKKS